VSVNHPVFRRLVVDHRITESEAMDIGPMNLRHLLQANVLSSHVDKTITFHARHVEEFVKAEVSLRRCVPPSLTPRFR
jgi:hypothetical protein